MKMCAAAGCEDLAVPGAARCDLHLAQAKERRDAAKARAQQTPQAIAGRRLYDDPKWKAAAKAFLRRFPLCADCGELGAVEPATDVDHIQPHRGDRKLFWDRSNWQPLCHRCHSRKTAREVWHRGVPRN